jgi:hypothetical protein
MTAQTQALVAFVWPFGASALALLAFALLTSRRLGWGALGRAAPSVGRLFSFATPTVSAAGEVRAARPGALVDVGGTGVATAARADEALNVWEGEGGRLAPAGHEAGEREGEGRAPSLSAGHTARLSWGLIDSAGRFAHEFFRVYGPGGRLDPGMSYWAVRAHRPFGGPDEARSGRWMTYGRARALAPGLTFARFSSPAGLPNHQSSVNDPALTRNVGQTPTVRRAGLVPTYPARRRPDRGTVLLRAGPGDTLDSPQVPAPWGPPARQTRGA